MPDRFTSIALDPAAVEALNSVLAGSDLASCVVDPQSRLAVIALNVFEILPDDGVFEEEYPLCLAVHPVGRVAASHVEEGSVQSLELENIDQVLSGFSWRGIEDWDMIDPPARFRFTWADKASLDMRWGDNQTHLLELGQDDSPVQLFNIALWFDDLYLFDKKLRPVSLEMLAEWRQRLRAAMDASVGPGGGWSRSIPAASPPVPSRIVEMPSTAAKRLCWSGSRSQAGTGPAGARPLTRRWPRARKRSRSTAWAAAGSRRR